MTHLDRNADFGRKHERKSWPQRVPSLATGHEAAVWSLKRAKKLSPSKRNCSPRWAFGLLIRNLQLHAAVDDIAFQPIQADDLLIAATVAEILLGNCPEGISVRYGMNAIVLGRL